MGNAFGLACVHVLHKLLITLVGTCGKRCGPLCILVDFLSFFLILFIQLS